MRISKFSETKIVGILREPRKNRVRRQWSQAEPARGNLRSVTFTRGLLIRSARGSRCLNVSLGCRWNQQQ